MTTQTLQLYRVGSSVSSMDQGKPLVFVHGYLGSRQIWHSALETLSQDFYCISLDLPGFGENAHLTAFDSIDAFASLIVSTLEKEGVSSCYLIGHSMGGQIAQQMTLQRPDMIDKVVLYGTGPQGSMPGRFETISESRRRLQAEGVGAISRAISATWFFDYEKSTHFSWVSQLAQDVSVQTADNCLVAMEDWNIRQQLHEIDTPTCIVWGDNDRSYAWTEQYALWTGIANANLAVIPRAAHAAHLDSPEMFASQVRTWLVDNGTQ